MSKEDAVLRQGLGWLRYRVMGSPAHCVLLGGQAACNTRWRRSLKPARPYIDRLIVLSRFTWPSTGLVVHGSSSAACTASISRRRPAAKLASGELSAASSTI